MKTPQIGSADDRRATTPASVLLIGGIDPRAGAGLLRDVLTAVALGARPIAVGTAWTEQGAGLHVVEARGSESLSDSIRYALSDGPASVKIGMVPDARAAAAILAGLSSYSGPVVVDPVLTSSRGGALFSDAPGELFSLLRRATLVTPNAAEAEILAGVAVRDLDDAEAAARALAKLGLAAVLVKGGHLGAAPEPVTDTLFFDGAIHRLSHARVPGRDVRGTGCALATAIAVQLGRGAEPRAAVEAATGWLGRALAAAVDVGDERHLGVV
ncbi:MAG TPA: PfkB family carbohydrate kinase [Polyangia bacterium]|nr:PfkB family carbohydrate kinase [Polyangia bacterium]